MNPTRMRPAMMAVCAGCLLAPQFARAQQTPDPNNPNTQYIGGSDPQGNAIRFARATGHISNYDESKVAPYTLPDPLKFADGRPVADAQVWFAQRRPEILAFYQTEIYGRIPDSAPKVTWEVVSTDPLARNGTAIRKQITGHIGGPDSPAINLVEYIPANAKGPVPVVLEVSFFGEAGPGGARGGARGGAAQAAIPSVDDQIALNNALKAAAAQADPSVQSVFEKNPNFQPIAITAAPPARGQGAGNNYIAEILNRGYGYAVVRYTDIEGDSLNGAVNIVRRLSLAPGQDAPAPDEWGTISAWAWGVSRILDYFQTDPSVDAKKIAIMGHSRLGKTVLWTGAQDERVALVFSSCGGEMGSALIRRDWGETLDDMAQNFSWQFAGNLQKYPGKWNELPVDAHFLIALNAPRPVFITGGTTDQWSDPRGQFLAAAAAGPVYEITGKKGFGLNDAPALDTAVITGDIGGYYHTGGHNTPLPDWIAFLDFADKYFKPAPATPAAN